MVLKLSLISLFLSLIMFSCNKPENTPNPQPIQLPHYDTIELNNKSLTHKQMIFQAKPEGTGSFQSGFTSVNTFELMEQNIKKTVTLNITIQSSNPPEGAYSLGNYEYYIGRDIYPGKGKVQMSLKVEGDDYYSKDDIEKNIEISHKSDSIEVSFEKCKLYSSLNSAIFVAGKLMLATKPEKLVYKGSATYNGMIADTLGYLVEDGMHVYDFFKKGNVVAENGLRLEFTEQLKETKTYKITNRLPVAADEVSLSVGFYVPSPMYNTDGRLYVTKEANGDFRFTFKDVPSPGGNGLILLYGNGVIKSFMP